MPGNPPTVLRHFTTPRGKDQRTVDYVGNRKASINFLNKIYVDLTSILLNVILLVAPWYFLFYLLRIGLVLDLLHKNLQWRPSREAHHVI